MKQSFLSMYHFDWSANQKARGNWIGPTLFFRILSVQFFFFVIRINRTIEIDYIMRLLLPAKPYRSQLQLRVLICSQNVNYFHLAVCTFWFQWIYFLIIVANSFFFTIAPWLATNHANKTIVLGRIFTNTEIQLKRKWTTRSANSSRSEKNSNAIKHYEKQMNNFNNTCIKYK